MHLKGEEPEDIVRSENTYPVVVRAQVVLYYKKRLTLPMLLLLGDFWASRYSIVVEFPKISSRWNLRKELIMKVKMQQPRNETIK